MMRLCQPRRSAIFFFGVFWFVQVCARHPEVTVAVVVGFARTDDGHHHRPGATFDLSAPRPADIIRVKRGLKPAFCLCIGTCTSTRIGALGAADTLEPEVRLHERGTALFGGPDGTPRPCVCACACACACVRACVRACSRARVPCAVCRVRRRRCNVNVGKQTNVRFPVSPLLAGRGEGGQGLTWCGRSSQCCRGYSSPVAPCSWKSTSRTRH